MKPVDSPQALIGSAVTLQLSVVMWRLSNVSPLSATGWCWWCILGGEFDFVFCVNRFTASTSGDGIGAARRADSPKCPVFGGRAESALGRVSPLAGHCRFAKVLRLIERECLPRDVRCDWVIGLLLGKSLFPNERQRASRRCLVNRAWRSQFACP